MKETSLFSAIGEEITAARERRGVTQVQLSARSGIAQSSISNIERGLARPSLMTLLRLSKALQMDLFTLLNGARGRLEAYEWR